MIETATPFLLRELPAVKRVIFASGEARDTEWNRKLTRALAPATAEFFTDPAFRYASEQRNLESLQSRIRAGLTRLLDGKEETLIWAHNLSIARNLPLAHELNRACVGRKITLLAHCHDWWFDNRWQRWPEMKRTGFRTLKQVAPTLFPTMPNVRFATINRPDAAQLRKHFGTRAGWLPNPANRAHVPSPIRMRRTRKWLCEKLGEDAPVWLMPCRVLRRKNVAEALLITRWLRPDAMLATTGGASSMDEKPYANQLHAAARKHGWRLRLGILERANSAAPSVNELIAASECVLLTSIQEGFGLASIEAAAAGRPLITRRLQNIAPDLHQFGFRFPHTYREILIAPDLFDWKAERARQSALFSKWKSALPKSCRASAEPPAILDDATATPIPFSRLTLTAQIEVLALPPAESWKRCAPWNPLLRVWKSHAARGTLAQTQWPEKADEWLDGCAYARRFAKIATGRARATFSQDMAEEAHAEFVRLKLSDARIYPLLLSHDAVREASYKGMPTRSMCSRSSR